jgi:hypothetical protein
MLTCIINCYLSPIPSYIKKDQPTKHLSCYGADNFTEKNASEIKSLSCHCFRKSFKTKILWDMGLLLYSLRITDHFTALPTDADKPAKNAKLQSRKTTTTSLKVLPFGKSSMGRSINSRISFLRNSISLS